MISETFPTLLYSLFSKQQQQALQIRNDLSTIAREDESFLLNFFSMLFNAGIKLYGAINHLESGYPPSPSKRGCTPTNIYDILKVF